MINISILHIFEIIVGITSFWIGSYLLSRNPRSLLSWFLFLFMFTTGVIIYTDPLLANSPDFRIYLLAQKITDWPIIFLSTFCLHLSYFSWGIVGKEKASSKHKIVIITAYVIGLMLYLADLHGGLLLKENIYRFEDFRRFDGFAPGILMIPFIIYCTLGIMGSIYYFGKCIKKGYKNFYLTTLGSIILIFTGIFGGFSYYIKIDQAYGIFAFGLSSSVLIYCYTIARFYKFLDSRERDFFGRDFFYKSIAIIVTVFFYLGAFWFTHNSLSFSEMVFLIILVSLIIASHSLYDWLPTFINDLVYNPSSGLSVVNDQEAYEVLKNYNNHQRLEDSSLLRLKAINKREASGLDSLRTLIRESIEYFKPEENPYRRTKKNLKYHLLRMMVCDEAEEGQMLWELGFEEYPVKILSQERRYRPPLFKIEAPSDYTYTSRNAFLALKKEAIHDITWRISYMEKQTKK